MNIKQVFIFIGNICLDLALPVEVKQNRNLSKHSFEAQASIQLELQDQNIRKPWPEIGFKTLKIQLQPRCKEGQKGYKKLYQRNLS